MAARIPWLFYDASTGDSYSLPINPADEGSNMRRKSFDIQNTSAPGGKVLIFEGRDEPRTASWTGTLLTEDQYNKFIDWFEKRHQFQVTDDLGRGHMVYIQGMDVRRRRSYQFPWRHEFTIEVNYLDWS